MGSIQFHRHRYTSLRHQYTSSQTPGYEFKTPVYKFTDTGIQVHRHRKREFFAILGDLKVEIEKSKNMGGLRIPPRYGIKQKKNSKILCHCPFNL